LDWKIIFGGQLMTIQDKLGLVMTGGDWRGYGK
jgi:hypothetical protein